MSVKDVGTLAASLTNLATQAATYLETLNGAETSSTPKGGFLIDTDNVILRYLKHREAVDDPDGSGKEIS
jgi:hypothetical protein